MIFATLGGCLFCYCIRPSLLTERPKRDESARLSRKNHDDIQMVWGGSVSGTTVKQQINYKKRLVCSVKDEIRRSSVYASVLWDGFQMFTINNNYCVDK